MSLEGSETDRKGSGMRPRIAPEVHNPSVALRHPSRPERCAGTIARRRIRMELERIRNTSIIAHIDHGKSTLADRMLELTGAVEARDMRAQYLDSMDLERERGITIKLQSVRLDWDDHVINLIDTPGHVDFGYEVSRSLAACESVILVVDAAQGIEAQTLANCYLAMENDLEIVACLNKIDLPAAEPDRYAREIENVLGIPADDILRISAKTGEGVPELLDACYRSHPVARVIPTPALQALIFDSHFDQYRGVISSIRVVNGVMRSKDKLRFMQAGASHDPDEIGVRTPTTSPSTNSARRDRLPHRRHQGCRRSEVRRDGDHREARRHRTARRLQGTQADGVLGSLPDRRRSVHAICARRWRSCGSTTAPSPSSRRHPARWDSVSGAASSACSTWKSCASASSASSGCR